FNEKLAGDSLAQFARDMSLAYNKAPNRIHWYECFWNLYLTFKPERNEDISRLPASSLLRRGSLPAPIDAAAKRITPIVQHVLNQPLEGNHAPIPVEMVQRLT